MTALVPSRREIISSWFALPLWAGLAAPIANAQSGRLAPTPQCCADREPTAAQSEGPFFTPGAPEKQSFRQDGRLGAPITLAGFVLTRDCLPVPGAVIELWHADGDGAYDNAGHALRGQQASDGQGRYLFETIVPGAYARRTRHFHVKVAPPGGRVLTTQLYFPNEPANRRDRLFDPRLVMEITRAADGKAARFDFVVAV